MKRNIIISVLIVIGLTAVCFAASRYTPPVEKEYHNLIAGLNDEFFTDFSPDQAAVNKTQSKATSQESPKKAEPLLPSWDFQGPEILQARETGNEQEKMIYEKYALRLQTMRKLANERLNILAAKALEEYNRVKPKGKFDKLDLANKYLTAMNCLQENLDSSFESEMDNMESELEKAGFSTAVIKELRSEYKDSKKEFENSLTQKFEQQGY